MKLTLKNGIIISLLFSFIGCKSLNDDEGDEYGEMTELKVYDNEKNDALVAEMMANNEKKPGWPAFPRKQVTFTYKSYGNTTLSLGLKVDVLGSEVSSTTNIGFGV
jgi:hypothetical protein